MSIAFKRASNQYLWTVDNAKFTYPNADWTVGFVLIVDGLSTITENQVIFSTGAIGAGSLICSYYGPAHPGNPNSIGITIGSTSTIQATPSGSITAGAWQCTIQRIGAQVFARWCPVRSTAPTDGSAVQQAFLANMSAALDGPNGLQIATRADRPLRLLDAALERLFRWDGQITTLEVAQLAFGIPITEMAGKTPLVFNFPFSSGTDYADTTGQAMTAVGAPYTTGPSAGYGYAQTAPSAPTVTSAPAIIGTPRVGVASSYTPGVYTGSPTPTVTRQWYINDVPIDGATAATYTPVASDDTKALDVEERIENASGVIFSGSAPVTVTSVPTAADSIVPFPLSNIFRSLGVTATVPASGTYSSLAPTTVEIQLYAATDNTEVVQTWTVLTGLVAANNVWSANLPTNRTARGYRAKCRFKNSSGVVYYTSDFDVSTSWGTGDIIVGAGSSTIHGWWTSGTYPGDGYLRRYQTISGKYAWEPFPASSNGVVKKIAGDLSTRKNAGVGMLGCGESGTTLAEWTATNSSLFNKMKAGIGAQLNKISALIMSMGSNDVADKIVSSRALHAAKLRKFIADTRALTPDTPLLPVCISGFNARVFTGADVAIYNAQSDYVRMAEQDVGSDPGVYHFSTFDLPLQGDGTHLASYTTPGDRTIHIFNPILAGDATYRRAPRIAAIVYTGAKFTVTIEYRNNGNDYTPATGISGFTAGDASGAATVLSAVRISATRIEVTCDRALGAGAWLKYMSGAFPDVSAPVFDNGTVSLPMDVETDMIAVEASAEPDTTAPVMVGTITISGTTTTGATATWQPATDNIAVAGYEYSINGAPYVNVGTARTFSPTGLTPGTTYTVLARAYDDAGNRSQPLSRSFTTNIVVPPDQGTVDGSKVPSARKVIFPGGTRVVPFGAAASAAVTGGPVYQNGRWTISKHELDEVYCVGDFKIDLAESSTVAVSVAAIVNGVTVLEQPVVQGTLVPIKIGGLNTADGALNFCTLRLQCENGEQIDRTIWFTRNLNSWTLSKDPDDKRFYVADVSRILADSNTQVLTAVPAVVVGVTALVQPAVQGSLLVVKLGGLDVAAAAPNSCTLAFACANSEKFVRTINFNKVDN